MKYETVVQRVGENLGPINYSYDFTKHDWGGGRGGVNPEVTKASVAQLRQLETLFADKMKRVQVRLMHSDCFWDVLAVGMYDGWPFWAPTPSVMVFRVLGSEWHPWYYVQDVRVVESASSVDAGATPRPGSQGESAHNSLSSSSGIRPSPQP
jgi:hypothetical protein